MPKVSCHTKQSGFSLVELLLASSIFTVIIFAFVSAFIGGREGVVLSGARNQATLLAESGLEAVRSIRNSDFNNIKTNGTYGISQSANNQWAFVPTSDVTQYTTTIPPEKFTRKVVISNGPDTNTKKIASTVTWTQSLQRTGSVTLTTYLTNWARNWWGNPVLNSSLALTGTNGTSMAISGNYAYATTANGAQSIFSIIDITDPANPVKKTKTVTIPGAVRTMTISGSYVYMASSGSANELSIVDISDAENPLLKWTYDAPGSSGGLGIYTVGTTVYLTGAYGAGTDTLSIIKDNGSSKPTKVGAISPGNFNVNDVAVSGNYAYIASADSTKEFQIIDVTDPALPTLKSSLDITGTNPALDIKVFGATAIISKTDGKIYFVDISDINSPALISTGTITLSPVGSASDIVLFNNDKYLACSDSATMGELQIWDIARVADKIKPRTPTILGTLNIGDGSGAFSPKAIAYSPAAERLFLIGFKIAIGGTTKQFVTIKPQ